MPRSLDPRRPRTALALHSEAPIPDASSVSASLGQLVAPGPRCCVERYGRYASGSPPVPILNVGKLRRSPVGAHRVGQLRATAVVVRRSTSCPATRPEEHRSGILAFHPDQQSPSAPLRLDNGTLHPAPPGLPGIHCAAEPSMVRAGRQRYAVLHAGDEPMLQGTWSSGSGKVTTGLLQPALKELHRSNRARPGIQLHTRRLLGVCQVPRDAPILASQNAFQSQLIWQHGNYVLHANGTLQLWPITREGAQLLTSSCPGGSPPEEMYDVPEEYTMVDTWIDLHHGVSSAALRLTDAWGNRSPSLYKIYDPPMMLPTDPLYLEYIGIP
ncbi:hypothetical protein L1887_57367 [Cichorium endivia]|nr:hypothetical protein L1887_57367 [Cichorium endivia]